MSKLDFIEKRRTEEVATLYRLVAKLLTGIYRRIIRDDIRVHLSLSNFVKMHENLEWNYPGKEVVTIVTRHRLCAADLNLIDTTIFRNLETILQMTDLPNFLMLEEVTLYISEPGNDGRYFSSMTHHRPDGEEIPFLH